MDYGTDPLISSMYASEHMRAAESLQPPKNGLLRSLALRREWKDQPLAELRDKMVTPDMMVAAGAKWGALQARHGTSALLEFGFRWPTMLAAGFNGGHLSTLSYEQVASLGLTAARMLECRPSARDISALRLQAGQLRELGWNAQLLAAIGLDVGNMVDFGYSVSTWRDVLGASDFRALGFTNYAQCARLGWRAADIEVALAAPGGAQGPIRHSETKGPVRHSETKGPIRFI